MLFKIMGRKLFRLEGMLIFLFVAGLLLQQGCGNEQFTPGVNCEEVTFSGNVERIFRNSCALPECHVPSNPERVDFTVFANIRAEGEEIIPWVERRSMPPAGAEPITQTEIEEIVCWIESGTPDN